MTEAAEIATAELGERVTYHQMLRAYEREFVKQYPLILDGQEKERRGVHRQEFLPGVKSYLEWKMTRGPGGAPTTAATKEAKKRHRAEQLQAAEAAMPVSDSAATAPPTTAGLRPDNTSAAEESDGEEMASIVLSKQRQEHWKAVKLELDQRERMQQLCRREDVEAAELTLHRRVVDSVMRLPSQAAVRISILTPAHVDILRELAWNSLKEISGGLETE